jgi:hypothetical protein
LGRMSELQIEVHQEQAVIHSRWTDTLTALIRASEYSLVEANEPPDGYDEDEWAMYDQMPDFSLRTGDGRLAAVELKIYRWQSDWKNHLKKAIDHLTSIIKAKHFDEGILIVTWDIKSAQIASAGLKVPSNIKLWDLGDLRQLSQKDSALQETLSDLIDETVMHADFIESITVSTSEQIGSEPEGSALARLLLATAPGKPGWRHFEDLCEAAFKLLFGKHITSWNRQIRTDDGLNRMDLIGRIQTTDDSFWTDIARDFRARYIVFEAKNHKKPIKQGQVLTTEKYLFTTALRPVAIIVAREGASPHAVQTAKGSLREHGKLILTLSLADMCSLLKSYDQGESPENLLFEKLDEMLMSLGR